MATLEKILLVLIAVMYGVMLVFGGFNFYALFGAVIVSALIRLVFKAMKGPKTIQEATMYDADFTGLNLTAPPTQKQ